MPRNARPRRFPIQRAGYDQARNKTKPQKEEQSGVKRQKGRSVITRGSESRPRIARAGLDELKGPDDPFSRLSGALYVPQRRPASSPAV